MVRDLVVHSERGGRVSLREPWEPSVVTDLSMGSTVPVMRAANVVSWETRAGESYRVDRG